MKRKRIIIKVGSATLYENEKLAQSRFSKLIEMLAMLNKTYEVILVSSGASAAGYTKCKLDRSKIANKQALAAIGQPLLMKEYKNEFAKYNQTVAQVLLTADDFDSRIRTKNAKNMIEVLLENKIIPIINENDAVAIEEFLVGDNDQLSAYVTYYFDADLLVILSDIDAFYDKNPSIYNDAREILVVDEINDEWLKQEHSPNNEFATGGIVTKLKAAKFLNDRGIDMFLSSGFDLKNVKSFLFENKQIGGTLFRGKK